ncbi:MAG: hypothetical protein HOE90_17710 [Bacteriovoracaceae bacterium]|jgi:hypothetical protein|nr:hypothetical protein [Bacteriovoracaceae bacterium]
MKKICVILLCILLSNQVFSKIANKKALNKINKCVRGIVEQEGFLPFYRNIKGKKTNDKIHPNYLPTIKKLMNILQSSWNQQHNKEVLVKLNNECIKESLKSKSLIVKESKNWRSIHEAKYALYDEFVSTGQFEKQFAKTLINYYAPRIYCHLGTLELSLGIVMSLVGGLEIGVCTGTNGKVYPAVIGVHGEFSLGLGGSVSVSGRKELTNFGRNRKKVIGSWDSGFGSYRVGVVGTAIFAANPDIDQGLDIFGFRGVGIGAIISNFSENRGKVLRVFPSFTRWKNVYKRYKKEARSRSTFEYGAF